MSNNDIEFELSKFQDKFHIVLNGAGLHALIEQISKGDFRDKVAKFIARHRIELEHVSEIVNRKEEVLEIQVNPVDNLKPETTVAQEILAKHKADKLAKEALKEDGNKPTNTGKSKKGKKGKR